MHPTVERRRTRFLKALATQGMTASGWAQQNGISKAHLSYVLRGERDSVRLNKKIDEYIRTTTSTAREAAVA